MCSPKKYLFSILMLGLGCLVTLPVFSALPKYPNFQDNWYLDQRMRDKIAPHLLPLTHPIKPVLDSIFSKERVLQSMDTFLNAGFEIIAGPMPLSFVIVARHPEVPGYVFKLYLDTASESRYDIPYWKWLVRRCEGARGIRNIIKKKKIRHFLVPDKYLYVLPVYPFSNVVKPQILILVETDMQVEPHRVTVEKWKTAKRAQLKELHSILKYGYAGESTRNLIANVPYTRFGKFAFTDTEDPTRKVGLRIVGQFFSKEMQKYWYTLAER